MDSYYCLPVLIAYCTTNEQIYTFNYKNKYILYNDRYSLANVIYIIAGSNV